MYLSTLLVGIATVPSLSYCFPLAYPEHQLRVKTDSGVLEGFIDATAPNVRQFLGVPFAEAPSGPRRWLPPTRIQSSALFNANNAGPGCPQNPPDDLTKASVYSPSHGNQTEYFPPQDFSEDCLTLNVWTPQSSRTDLPLIVWYYGSGFTQGGTKSLYYNPQSWIQRTKEHIVVSVNVRANVFGFPNAPGLKEQNLGLLDQRLSLEWVRDNIAAFGGDPSKIVAWGQSSGAIAVDYINFAYAPDPIVSGMILDSATAFYPTEVRQSADSAQSNFTAVAVALGCGLAPSQVDCLRNVSWQDIASVLKGDISLKFLPVVDERIVFSDYSRLYEEAAVSSIPAIIGTNQHEYNIGIPQPLGLNFTQTESDIITNVTTLCTAAHASQIRQSSSRRTYRYRYDGNFPNISPAGYPGAYHTAELPLIFGTDAEYHGPSTAEEKAVGRTLQNLWLDFAKDPEHGLRSPGWSPYEDCKAVLLGYTDYNMKEINVSELDGVCSSLKGLPQVFVVWR